MEIFISWSGERSKGLAEALRSWLPKIMNAVSPWLSSADIDKGARWGSDVAGKLATAKVGIICLTPGNLHSDWILFEAGALSKTLQNTYVCPLLLDLAPSAVSGPLAQFQATRATKEEIKKLIETINTALADRALPATHIDEAYEVWWPKLEAQINSLPSEAGDGRPKRDERDILEEILALVRQNAREMPGSDSDAARGVGRLRRFILREIAATAANAGIPPPKVSTADVGSDTLVVQLVGGTAHGFNVDMPDPVIRILVTKMIDELRTRAVDSLLEAL